MPIDATLIYGFETHLAKYHMLGLIVIALKPALGLECFSFFGVFIPGSSV